MIKKGCDVKNMTAAIGPTISLKNYEVKEDLKKKFIKRDKKKECDALNIDAVQYLVEVSEQIDAHLIHISTDFIFDGKNSPYTEDAVPNPLSYYGLSKLKSETLLLESSCRWTVLRTIIVFGVAENLSKGNIVLWAKGELEKREKLNIIDTAKRVNMNIPVNLYTIPDNDGWLFGFSFGYALHK